MNLRDMLQGEVVVPLRGVPRFVRGVSGRKLEPSVRKFAKAIASKRENALTYRNRKADPVRHKARMEFTAKWRADHPEAVKGYRRKARKTKAYKLYQREWRRAQRKLRGRRQPRGEQVAVSKLNPAKVVALRARYAAGGIALKALGAEFGVSFSSARKIVRREMWAHIA